MGPPLIWEPGRHEPLRGKRLGAEQVPITLWRCDVSEQSEQIVMRAFEGALAEVRRQLRCQDVELVGWIDPQVQFGRSQAGMAEPESNLPDVAGSLEGMKCAGVA